MLPFSSLPLHISYLLCLNLLLWLHENLFLFVLFNTNIIVFIWLQPISAKYSPLPYLPNTHFYYISQILTSTTSPKYILLLHLPNTYFYYISQILIYTISPKYSLIPYLPITHFYHISQILTSTTSPKYSLIRNFLTSSNISPYFHSLLTPQNVLLPLTTAVTWISWPSSLTLQCSNMYKVCSLVFILMHSHSFLFILYRNRTWSLSMSSQTRLTSSSSPSLPLDFYSPL